jgi:hypothetical protein
LFGPQVRIAGSVSVDVGMGVESLTGNTICLLLVQATKQHLDFFFHLFMQFHQTLFFPKYDSTQLASPHPGQPNPYPAFEQTHTTCGYTPVFSLDRALDAAAHRIYALGVKRALTISDGPRC